MIAINLLPEEFRVVEKVIKKKPPIFKIIFLIVGIFVLVTCFFYVDYLTAQAKLADLTQDWAAKQPQFQQLTLLRDEVDGALKQEKDFMERFVTTDKPLTSILEWVSELLPETSWLKNVTLTRNKGSGNLLIQGVVLPSEDASSISQIELYLQALKAKMPDSNLSLTTTRQIYNTVPLTQFVANFSWGEKE